MDRTVSAGLGPALVLALLGGCLSAASGECRRPGQILWERGSDPARDAPRWTQGGNAALRAAGVRIWEALEKYVVYVDVSEDRGDQRGAQFSGVEDMLQRYAV